MKTYVTLAHLEKDMGYLFTNIRNVLPRLSHPMLRAIAKLISLKNKQIDELKEENEQLKDRLNNIKLCYKTGDVCKHDCNSLCKESF
jgi:hypothetical protein